MSENGTSTDFFRYLLDTGHLRVADGSSRHDGRRGAEDEAGELGRGEIPVEAVDEPPRAGGRPGRQVNVTYFNQVVARSGRYGRGLPSADRLPSAYTSD